MHNASIRRKTLLVLIVAVLATPWCATSAPRTASGGPAQAGELFRFDFLGHLWNVLHSAWSKEGCRIDPDGHCLPNAMQPPSPPAHPKSGCRIDPNGQCLSGPVQPKEGCGIDPNGQCLPATQTDTGCGIDPNGRCHP